MRALCRGTDRCGCRIRVGASGDPALVPLPPLPPAFPPVLSLPKSMSRLSTHGMCAPHLHAGVVPCDAHESLLYARETGGGTPVENSGCTRGDGRTRPGRDRQERRRAAITRTSATTPTTTMSSGTSSHSHQRLLLFFLRSDPGLP
ncbi:hypothetical protein H180DRAFT_00328 [Streptomyces sp. WMMB 322]|nr:hypothetical protein H180DRAFT_00328 [Streptomyces sp. WMMB 322]